MDIKNIIKSSLHGAVKSTAAIALAATPAQSAERPHVFIPPMQTQNAPQNFSNDDAPRIKIIALSQAFQNCTVTYGFTVVSLKPANERPTHQDQVNRILESQRSVQTVATAFALALIESYKVDHEGICVKGSLAEHDMQTRMKQYSSATVSILTRENPLLKNTYPLGVLTVEPPQEQPQSPMQHAPFNRSLQQPLSNNYI